MVFLVFFIFFFRLIVDAHLLFCYFSFQFAHLSYIRIHLICILPYETEIKELSFIKRVLLKKEIAFQSEIYNPIISFENLKKKNALPYFVFLSFPLHRLITFRQENNAIFLLFSFAIVMQISANHENHRAHIVCASTVFTIRCCFRVCSRFFFSFNFIFVVSIFKQHTRPTPCNDVLNVDWGYKKKAHDVQSRWTF